ncbi:hypothetical protein CMU70_11370 [Elizabethkingia anophelis]|nr:hypothetical protein [Elizabethkingia anophelis]
MLYIDVTPYESNLVYLKDFLQSGGSYKLLHKDYLATILAISDEGGNLLEEAHFDAWGLCAKWRKSGVLSDLAEGERLLNRGYISHEHFEDVGIIHMNGRLYDPLLRRFLYADENIQDPYNTQNYNKYGYVINNPLMYNDPNGQFLQVLFAIFEIISLVIATVQLVSMIVLLAAGNITFGQFLKFFLVQAVSALISYGVGEIFKPGGFAIKVLGKATAKLAKPLVHALSQGVLSVMRGESFVNGFGTALLASFAAGYGLKLGGSEQWSRALGATISGAIGGGVGSILTGGNFWQGAATGAIIGFFNESMHDEGPGDSSDRVGNPRKVTNPITGEKELSGDIQEVVLNKKSTNIMNDPSGYFNTVNKVGTSLDFITAFVGQQLPKTVGVFGKYAGPVALVADVSANITDCSLGKISSYKAMYNTTGAVSSFSVGYLTGSEVILGSGGGAVMGLLPAVEFKGYGELWDFYKPRFVQGRGGFISNL